jgi:hypothetical protein
MTCIKIRCSGAVWLHGAVPASWLAAARNNGIGSTVPEAIALTGACRMPLAEEGRADLPMLYAGTESRTVLAAVITSYCSRREKFERRKA